MDLEPLEPLDPEGPDTVDVIESRPSRSLIEGARHYRWWIALVTVVALIGGLLGRSARPRPAVDRASAPASPATSSTVDPGSTTTTNSSTPPLVALANPPVRPLEVHINAVVFVSRGTEIESFDLLSGVHRTLEQRTAFPDADWLDLGLSGAWLVAAGDNSTGAGNSALPVRTYSTSLSPGRLLGQAVSALAGPKGVWLIGEGRFEDKPAAARLVTTGGALLSTTEIPPEVDPWSFADVGLLTRQDDGLSLFDPQSRSTRPFGPRGKVLDQAGGRFVLNRGCSGADSCSLEIVDTNDGSRHGVAAPGPVDQATISGAGALAIVTADPMRNLNLVTIVAKDGRRVTSRPFGSNSAFSPACRWAGSWAICPDAGGRSLVAISGVDGTARTLGQETEAYITSIAVLNR